MNTFGAFLRLTSFGESHGKAIGGVLDNLPAGLAIDVNQIQSALDERAPGKSMLTSQRKEPDTVEILSGVTLGGLTNGAPLAFLIRNEDANAEDYRAIQSRYRPGHGDFTWEKKFGVMPIGGGRLSGRETAVRVVAGAIAKRVLEEAGVSCFGHVRQIGDIEAKHFDKTAITQNEIGTADHEAALKMAALIKRVQEAGDSLGGVVEVVAEGVPIGLGEPLFGKLDAMIGQAMFSIGAVKGVEIGAGFSLAAMRGSEANDEIGRHCFQTNHAGGMLGGISNGESVVVRLAVKPTPSIGKTQATITTKGEAAHIETKGRHDPCIAIRVRPVAVAMLAFILADFYLIQKAKGSFLR